MRVEQASPRAASGGVATRSLDDPPPPLSTATQQAPARSPRSPRGSSATRRTYQDALPNGGRARTVMEAVRAIHAEGGVRAFYHGLGLAAARASERLRLLCVRVHHGRAARRKELVGAKER